MGITVFLASPGDVQEERDRVESVKAFVNGVLAERGIVVEVQRWEEMVPGSSGRLQDVILEQTRPYDIFVGIMWHRVGTDTGRAASGTIEEFEIAHDAWRTHGRPRIMFYF